MSVKDLAAHIEGTSEDTIRKTLTRHKARFVMVQSSAGSNLWGLRYEV